MRMSVFERYRNDAAFNKLVDLIYAELERHEFTPTELREACHVAACKYETTHIRPIVLTQAEWDRLPGEIRSRLSQDLDRH